MQKKLIFPLTVCILLSLVFSGCSWTNPAGNTPSLMGIDSTATSILTATATPTDDSNPEEVPEEVEVLLVRYFEACKTDMVTAASYRYFARPEERQFFEASIDYMVEYEILGWKKLNDNLWVAATSAKLQSYPDSIITYHFVAWFDSQYYVMSVFDVEETAQIKKNVDLTPYYPTDPNILDPDEFVIGWIPIVEEDDSTP